MKRGIFYSNSFVAEENRCYWETTFLIRAQLTSPYRAPCSSMSQSSTEEQECGRETDKERRHRADWIALAEQGLSYSKFFPPPLPPSSIPPPLAFRMGHQSLRLVYVLASNFLKIVKTLQELYFPRSWGSRIINLGTNSLKHWLKIHLFKRWECNSMVE